MKKIFLNDCNELNLHIAPTELLGIYEYFYLDKSPTE